MLFCFKTCVGTGKTLTARDTALFGRKVSIVSFKGFFLSKQTLIEDKLVLHDYITFIFHLVLSNTIWY